MNKLAIAEKILNELDEYISIDWNFKELYIKAIKKGLDESEKLGFLE